MRGRTKEKSTCRKAVTKKDKRRDIIKGRARIAGLGVKDIARRTGLSLSTLYRKLKNPDDLTLLDLDLIDSLVEFSDEEILYFVRWRRCKR